MARPGVLRCHCHNSGPRLVSEVEVGKGCEAVDNINGRLECAPLANERYLSTLFRKAAFAFAKALSLSLSLSQCEHAQPACLKIHRPSGGYLDSCLGCVLVGLGAPQKWHEHLGPSVACSHCDAANGDRAATRYALLDCPAPGSLDNNDGRLECSGLTNAEGLPRGGYLDSCRGCRLLRGTTLECSHCRTAGGHQQRTQFKLKDCPPPYRLDNHDGSLACGH